MARRGSKGRIRVHNKGGRMGGHRPSSNARVPRQHGPGTRKGRRY